jgi:hypothetical protein
VPEDDAQPPRPLATDPLVPPELEMTNPGANEPRLGTEDNSAILYVPGPRWRSTHSLNGLAYRLSAAQKAMVLVAGLFGTCLVVMVLAFALTRSVAATATEFLELAARDPEAAYARTSPSYRARMLPAGFIAFVRHICVDRMRSVTWYGRQLGGRSAGVSGDLTLADGTRVPVEVALTRSNGTWLISDLLGPEEVGRARPVEGRILPSDRKLQELIEESVGAFVTAIQKRDFAPYYAGLAQRGRRLTAATDLPRMYKHALGQPLDLMALRERPPEWLVPPVLERDGTLRLRGRYKALPLGLRFELRYVYEDGEWRLMTAKFDLDPPEGVGSAPVIDKGTPARAPSPGRSE